jgi:hypoxanthine-DNA glycosylase
MLGSLPGEKSLALQQYYGNPQNRFWMLMSEVIKVDLTALAYALRLQTLLQHGVGLWDVIAEAERQGSLDSDIRSETHNHLANLIATLPRLAAIGFNGGTAARIGRRQLREHAPQLDLIDLPSSSPAYTLALAEKHKAWKILQPYLQAPDF